MGGLDGSQQRFDAHARVVKLDDRVFVKLTADFYASIVCICTYPPTPVVFFFMHFVPEEIFEF